MLMGEPELNRAYGTGESPVSPVALQWKEFCQFRTWLYDEAGIQLADAKQALVSGRLGKRLRVLKMRSFGAYFDYISRGNTPEQRSERQVALDLLTTNETYFLREKAHFDYLSQQVLPAWRGRALKCWSAASSSGEEAYTLAMLLADEHPADWRITGTDISSRVVSQAQQGVYPMARAEKIPRPWLHKYCRKGIGDKTGTFRVAQEIRRNVSFLEANLQQPQTSLGPFDIIFLRNVMIYFDVTVKKRVLANVIDRLKPDGIIMVGHSESLNGISDRVRLLSPSIYRLTDNEFC
jgi:chemotaxis protein methyltransferase CheR